MNDHLCGSALYRACGEPGLLGEQRMLVVRCSMGEMNEGSQRVTAAQSISCGLLLIQIGKLEFGLSRLIGRQHGWWIHPSSPGETVYSQQWITHPVLVNLQRNRALSPSLGIVTIFQCSKVWLLYVLMGFSVCVCVYVLDRLCNWKFCSRCNEVKMVSNNPSRGWRVNMQRHSSFLELVVCHYPRGSRSGKATDTRLSWCWWTHLFAPPLCLYQ